MKRFYRWRYGILTLGLTCVAAFEPATAGTKPVPWQSLDSITQAAIAQAKTTYAGPRVRLDVKVKAMDARLKLARCSRSLETFVPQRSNLAAHSVVGVRCTGVKPWKIYVPVKLAQYRQVLVTRVALAKGDSLSDKDVRLEERDVANLRSAYLTAPRQLQGKLLRRTLPAGTLVTMNQMQSEQLVKRGQAVTLLAKHQGVSVRMAGTALADGTASERIRVQNMSSKRVIEGVVQDRNTVLVDL